MGLSRMTGGRATRMISGVTVVFLLILDLSRGYRYDCGVTELRASTLTSDQYETPGYPSFYETGKGYDENMYCQVKFEAFYVMDRVEISIEKTDMPRRNNGECGSDKVTFYDGDSTNSPVLATVCGHEIQTLESSGHVILMVFETGSRSSGMIYKGMKLTYKGIDHGGFDEHSVEVPVLIVVVILLAVVFVLVAICVGICICCRRKRNSGTVFSRNPPQVVTTQSYNVQQPQQPYYPPGPNQGYPTGPNQGYPAGPNQGYPPGPNQGYPPSPNQGYPAGPNQGYPPGPNQGYPAGPNQCYPAGPNQGYPAGPTQPYSAQPKTLTQSFTLTQSLDSQYEAGQPLLSQNATYAHGLQPTAPPPYMDGGSHGKPPLPP